MKELQVKVESENENKGIIINNKKTECTIITGSKKCEVRIRDIRITQLQKFNYLVSVITDDAYCDTDQKVLRNSERGFPETK